MEFTAIFRLRDTERGCLSIPAYRRMVYGLAHKKVVVVGERGYFNYCYFNGTQPPNENTIHDPKRAYRTFTGIIRKNKFLKVVIHD